MPAATPAPLQQEWRKSIKELYKVLIQVMHISTFPRSQAKKEKEILWSALLWETITLSM